MMSLRSAALSGSPSSSNVNLNSSAEPIPCLRKAFMTDWACEGSYKRLEKARSCAAKAGNSFSDFRPSSELPPLLYSLTFAKEMTLTSSRRKSWASRRTWRPLVPDGGSLLPAASTERAKVMRNILALREIVNIIKIGTFLFILCLFKFKMRVMKAHFHYLWKLFSRFSSIISWSR